MAKLKAFSDCNEQILFTMFALFTIAYSAMTFARNLSTLRRSRLGGLMNDPTHQCNAKFIFHFIYMDLLNA